MFSMTILKFSGCSVPDPEVVQGFFSGDFSSSTAFLHTNFDRS